MKKILLLCLLILACEEKYTPLWHEDLYETEAAEIAAYLRENKYEYKLEKRTILVPKETLYEIRMALARNGLPKNHSFTDPSFPIIITEFLQNTKHRWVVETELARSIEKKLREVEKATVSLNKDTTAFVKIKLHPTSKGLNENKIETIKRFVASAVNELKTERVWVLDDKRNELSDEKSNMARLDTYNADGDAEVAEITAYLRENKYEYKLIYNGCITIFVPKESLREIRMALEKEGFPKNLKNISIVRPVKSITEFLQNPELRQALEKELARSIETIVKTASGVDISEVEEARVSINKDTTALVMIQLYPYRGLNEKQIKGIQHLVAIAVDELKAEQVRVCVIDHKGNALTKYCPERKAVRSCGSSCGD